MAIQASQDTHQRRRARAPRPSARSAPHRTIPLRLDEADADRLAQLVAKRQEEDSSRRVTATEVLRELIREAS